MYGPISKDLSVIDIIDTLTSPPATPDDIDPPRAANNRFVDADIESAESTPADLSSWKFVALAALVAAALVAALLASVFQSNHQPAQTSTVRLARPFVIIDGAGQAEVTIQVGDARANSFIVANMPATVALDGQPEAMVAVTIQNAAGESSCSIGSDNEILVTNTGSQRSVTCSMALP